MVTSRQLYQGVCTQLLQSELLSDLSLDRKFVQQEIESPHFIACISKMADERDFSVQATYRLCEPMLAKLWGNSAPEEPLFYIYQYALSLAFPDSIETPLREEWTRACRFYLEVLRVVAHYQKKSDDQSMLSRYPLNFLTEEEDKLYGVSKEYQLFKQAFQQEYIYEMMKLNQEIIHHNTLDHICGVHHLAMSIARQLYALQIPVDLGRVSGAAAGHDLGKFGCRSWEGNRVAYLHYYYTDVWFKKRQIPYIGHIAVNHSTWDLELENLSIESLLLIYSDFRVKNIVNPQGKLEMKFFSLKDSFDVILNKLDNVDTHKKRRYSRVYDKLKDFEAFILHLGVQVNPDVDVQQVQPTRHREYYSLMRGKQITEHLKYLAIHHNIHLMHQFRNETSLNEILEVARSEKSSHILREYLDVFQEYSTYLTQKQKMITLRFLYEKLTHPEEDIRRQCAELMGNIIGHFDEVYRKELPKGVMLPPPEVSSYTLLSEYLQDFVNPDHKIIPLHRQWIGYCIKVLLISLFESCSPTQADAFKGVLLQYYRQKGPFETDTNLCLLDVVKHIPLQGDEEGMKTILSYIEDCYRSTVEDVRIAALEALETLVPALKGYPEMLLPLKNLLSQSTQGGSPAENYLMLRIFQGFQWDKAIISHYQGLLTTDLSTISNIFLSNLKTATNWVSKKVQVQMLLAHYLEHKQGDGLYTAIHYCNLLKVSAIEGVRKEAGNSLITLFPHLPLEQRNDLAIELLRALEIEGYQFTKYIPGYLGIIVLYLRPFELDEIITDIEEKIKQSNSQIINLLLRTLGIILDNYPQYPERFPEAFETYQRRRQRMLGILLNGLVHDHVQIRQTAFSVLGKGIFGSQRLSLGEKHQIFQFAAKKILTLLADAEENQLLFLTNSSGLNHIYRFIADYSFLKGPIAVREPKRIAFFPGTFDPFTLGHKEISRAIRDLGFEVYLAVDEFSWSKRTQPNLIRKNIINMSIADEMDIYLYPEDFPTNLAQPENLKRLKENLQSDQVYLVAGTDVLLNASAYKAPPVPNAVFDFSHVLFQRELLTEPNSEEALAQVLKKINGNVIRLNLPPQLEEISSTQIRNYIDQNRDISKLIDPLAQRYIYENNLYRRAPQYKSMLQPLSTQVEFVPQPSQGLLETLVRDFHRNSEAVYHRLATLMAKPEGEIILIRDQQQGGQPIAYGAIHWIPSEDIYREFQNSVVTQIVRESYRGRIISLDGFFLRDAEAGTGLLQRIITEVLAYCVKKDYGYGVYSNAIDSDCVQGVEDLIELQGFLPLPSPDGQPRWAVDMTHPCTLNLDLSTIIKEPFRSNPAVQEVIGKTRVRLQQALTKLYPGHLLLSFDREMVDELLVKRICEENGVPPVATTPRTLGPLMCVPFGSILSHTVVPNTVTKALHVEKLFNPDMKGFSIGPYPYYLDLPNQIKVIASFKRPVILVDDVLNKGYRIKGLEPLLKEQQVEVKKILVGILSGRGKELMEIQNKEVDCAYFIPKLRLWFNENLLYPFIGGDTLWRGVYPKKNLLPSINLILPYTSPHFITQASNQSIYELSEVALENAAEILEVLEQEYQRVNERRLTLSLLGDVFIYPRYPDAGKNMQYDFSLNPSSYIQNDLEQLKKLAHSVITSDGRS